MARIRKDPVLNIEGINMPNEFELDVWRELEFGIDIDSCRNTSGKSGEFEGPSLLTKGSGGSLGRLIVNHHDLGDWIDLEGNLNSRDLIPLRVILGRRWRGDLNHGHVSPN